MTERTERSDGMRKVGAPLPRRTPAVQPDATAARRRRVIARVGPRVAWATDAAVLRRLADGLRATARQ